MNNKKWIAAGAATMAIIIAIAACVLVDSRGKNEVVETVSSSSEAVDDVTIDAAPDPGADVEIDEPESPDETGGVTLASKFVELDYDDDNSMVGKAEYFDLTFWQTWAKSNFESLGLEPKYENGVAVTTTSGHQVYYSAEKDAEFLVSGVQPLALTFTADFTGNGYLREEGTGIRIHSFGSASAATAFLTRWEQGQKILSGEVEGEYGSIILDGQLLPYTYTVKDGEMYFSLREIAPVVSSQTYYTDDLGYFAVYVNDFASVTVPTNLIHPAKQQQFGVETDFRGDMTFVFKGWNGNSFQLTLPVIDALSTEISAETAARMFGWRMYTDGSVLSIVTDPLNVSNKIEIRESGDLGVRIVLETDSDGSQYLRAYDSVGTLLWEQVFDSSAVDAAMAELEESGMDYTE